jgi:internalin A
MRGLLSRIGGEAGMAGVYWKDGACLYERTTHSQARIVQQVSEKAGEWSGSIVIRTQGGRSMDLARMLDEWACETSESAGCITKDSRFSRKAVQPEARDAESATPEGKPEKPDFAIPPRKTVTYAVSYAWREKVNGKVRDEQVDQLCREAAARGIHVMRDIDDLGLGEEISKFMSTLAEQERVFVILSDKYLRSENCMFELKEVWRYCQENAERFRERVFVYRLPDADIHDLGYQLAIAEHWLTAFDAARPRIEKLAGRGALAESALRRFNNMNAFATIAGEILGYVADTLRPGDFEDFLRHGLGGKE